MVNALIRFQPVICIRYHLKAIFSNLVESASFRYELQSRIDYFNGIALHVSNSNRSSNEHRGVNAGPAMSKTCIPPS
ncbi:hypothetical protein D3C86_1863060 [compost metagenome]